MRLNGPIAPSPRLIFESVALDDVLALHASPVPQLATPLLLDLKPQLLPASLNGRGRRPCGHSPGSPGRGGCCPHQIIATRTVAEAFVPNPKRSMAAPRLRYRHDVEPFIRAFTGFPHELSEELAAVPDVQDVHGFVPMRAEHAPCRAAWPRGALTASEGPGRRPATRTRRSRMRGRGEDRRDGGRRAGGVDGSVVLCEQTQPATDLFVGYARPELAPMYASRSAAISGSSSSRRSSSSTGSGICGLLAMVGMVPTIATSGLRTAAPGKRPCLPPRQRCPSGLEVPNLLVDGCVGLRSSARSPAGATGPDHLTIWNVRSLMNHGPRSRRWGRADMSVVVDASGVSDVFSSS